MSYKVGDKVKFIKFNKRQQCKSGFVSEMERFSGKIVTLTGIHPSAKDEFKIDLDSNNWWWSDDLFESKYNNIIILKLNIE